MARRRHGKCAELRVVLILKAKSDSVPGILGRGSLSWVRRTSGRFSLTLLSDNTIPIVLDQLLILTPEFGPGVTLGARLTRVVPLCV
ncbi:hypothetical protein Tco_0113262, partial [Tanacetum coccineum]